MSGGYRGMRFSRPSKHWDDPLSRMDTLKFEALVADYYRGQGYRVVECGTGGTKGRYDGGIDLKLYRDDEYIVVQCKRYTNSVVKHNDVHQLLGIMHTEGATRAIFINSGEYSRHALRKLHGIPNFQMIDGMQLREMIGPHLQGIEEPISSTEGPYGVIARSNVVEKQRLLAKEAASRLAQRGHTYVKAPRKHAAELGPVLKIAAAIAFLWALHQWTKSFDSQQRTRISAVAQQHALEQSPSNGSAPLGQVPSNGRQVGQTHVRTNTLRSDERCINKQRFRRLPNGWEQIGSC
jgi:hypothetical protein